MGTAGSTQRAKWDFFISYATADQTWAEWVAWQLEEAGYRVLIQKWDLVPGAQWTSRLEEGIRGSERTLAILSHAYFTSVYGQAEWTAAFRADPQGFARTLVPVRVEDCEPRSLLSGIVSVDLFGCSEDAARQTLLDKIREARSGRAKPSTAPAFPSQGPAPTDPFPLQPSTASPPQHDRPSAAPEFPGRTPPLGATVARKERNRRNRMLILVGFTAAATIGVSATYASTGIQLFRHTANEDHRPQAGPTDRLELSPSNGSRTSMFTVSGSGCPDVGSQVTIYMGAYALFPGATCSSSHTFSRSYAPHSDGTLTYVDGNGTNLSLQLKPGQYNIHAQNVPNNVNDAPWVSPTMSYHVDS
jgi:hypothetical protein